MSEAFDVVVMGTGAAGLSAALSAHSNGANVLVVEKSSLAGGTTAMSGGCIWVPRHHYAERMGVTDSREAVLEYIHAVSPEGWHNREASAWAAFVDYAPEMLLFLEANTPLKFNPNRDPDPYAEEAGGLPFGRNVSAAPMRIGMLGDWKDKVRQPTSDLRLSYEEIADTFLFANPKKWVPRYLPRLAWRKLMNMRARGNALTIGLLKGCLDKGIEIRLSTPARRLEMTNGRVSGLEIGADDARELVRIEKGVVLASGGF